MSIARTDEPARCRRQDLADGPEPRGPHPRHRPAVDAWCSDSSQPGASAPMASTASSNATAPPAVSVRPPRRVPLLPTLEDKEAAWRAAVDPTNCPTRCCRDGRRLQPARPRRAEPRVRRPLLRHARARLAQKRTNETAQTLVIGLYPSFLVEQRHHRPHRGATSPTHESPRLCAGCCSRPPTASRRALRAQSAH